MKKIITLFIGIILSSIKLFASVSDDQIVYAMLMNQIQYSLQVIQHYDNKLVLEQEYDNIICKIDKTKLKDENEDAIAAYSNMLTTLTDLKLQENQKLFIKQQAEKEKSEAVYQTLSGTALPAIASLYQMGKGIAKADIGSIISGATSFVYTGVSVAFNYRNAVNSVENSLNKEMFEIGQDQLKSIDAQRNSLFKTYSRFITKYKIPKEYEIKEDQMLWLVSTLDSADPAAKVRLLEAKKEIFKVFTPFWYELGSAYQSIGNIAEAKKCYAEFEKQKEKYSIIDNDTYHTELAKNMIQIARDSNDIKTIRKYLKIIENDKTVANESENRFYLAGVYFSLEEHDTAQKFLKLIIDDNRKFVSQARELYEYIEAFKTTDSVYKEAILLGQLKIASEEDVKNAVLEQKGKSNVAKDVLNFFFGTEEEKVIYTDKLAFVLPESYGKDYSLSILIGEKYYDSVSFNLDGKTYFFINFPLKKFIERFEEFSVILVSNTGEQTILKYVCNYYDSSDVKTFTKTFNQMHAVKNELPLDISNVSHIDIGMFLAELKLLEKDKAYKKSEDAKQQKILTEKYEKAASSFIKQVPYKYKNSLLFKPKSYLFNYGLVTIATKTQDYEISKYGELISPKSTKPDLPKNLNDIYQNALLGDSEAEYNLAMAYLNGEDIEINYIESLKWFKLSGMQNNMKSLYQLGLCFENGYGTEKNKDRAMYYYQKAAKLGHQKAKAKVEK